MKLIHLRQSLLIGVVALTSTGTHANTVPDLTQLAKDSYWLKLGHYLPNTLSGHTSTVDSDTFFFASDGKTSPINELRATFNAFYHQPQELANQARCRFPARYTWLETVLGREAKLDCDELNAWRDVLDPAGLTLVFPTAFMNNPSSMFGHTLLRIDTKDQTRHKELVAFAVNFAAEPDTQDNAALYALKGLVGSYPGRYTVMPYYRKVREYNDMESRDIWEYKLKLSQDEVERVLLHLWEMQDIEFDYYFLDENCSYQLLALLETARDDLFLVEDFPFKAIPSDTVEALANNSLLEEPSYREAFGTRLLHQSNQIDQSLFLAAEKAKQGVYPTKSEYTDVERAAILEFAYEWLNFELYDLGLERDPTAKQLTALLYQRSRIKIDSPYTPVPKPSVSPDEGHASARIGVSYQYSDSYLNLGLLEWRAAYHDLLDSPAGYIPGAQISFLDLQVSIGETSQPKLDKLYVFDAMALAPSNRIFDSWAWNIRTGFDRKPADDDPLGRWFVQGGFGKAWGRSDKLHLYSLASAEISGGELTDYQATLGAGIESGIYYQLTEQNRLGLEGQYLSLFHSEAQQNAKITASWHWSLSRHFAIRGQVNYQHWKTEELGSRITGYFYF